MKVIWSLDALPLVFIIFICKLAWKPGGFFHCSHAFNLVAPMRRMDRQTDSVACEEMAVVLFLSLLQWITSSAALVFAVIAEERHAAAEAHSVCQGEHQVAVIQHCRPLLIRLHAMNNSHKEKPQRFSRVFSFLKKVARHSDMKRICCFPSEMPSIKRSVTSVATRCARLERSTWTYLLILFHHPVKAERQIVIIRGTRTLIAIRVDLYTWREYGGIIQGWRV